MQGTEKPPGFDALIAQTAGERQRTRRLVREGRWKEAEPEFDRLVRFNEKRMRRASRGMEAIQGNTNDLQQVSYLTQGSAVRRAVGYIEVSDSRATGIGSGFMISPRLILTNRHVVRDETAARAAQVTFDREIVRGGRLSPTTTFALAPATFCLFSNETDLDYALIAVGGRLSGEARLEDIGHCCISDAPDRHVIGMSLNIIQHPLGLPKMIAIRNNLLTWRTDRALLYETDTEQGSSGSPVFNDDWDIVALHHWGEPYLAKVDESGTTIPTNVNEGVRISAVVRDLRKRLPELDHPLRAMLDEALTLGATAATVSDGPTLSGPRPRPEDSSESLTTAGSQGESTYLEPSTMTPQQTIRVVVPVEITLRVGNALVGDDSGPTELSLTSPSTSPSPTLRSAAEAMQLDPDYENRSGYREDFIPGHTIPLPEIVNSRVAGRVAPLRSDQPNAEEGRLDYEHFTIKMNRSKRLAMFTATNIDGEQYLSVDRKTGRVSEEAEGDKWFKDARISESFWTGQDFYSEWSVYFDRGHLTRRNDPTWGDAETAERANADTFHWTNCSPQHFRFNQTAKYWQGAERYVLENGILSAEEGKPISVFQGPIFDARIDRNAGEVQIPSSYFKIVVWRGANGLKSVGLIVDQLPLMDEKRKSFGAPKDMPRVFVNQWRVAIPVIEKRTGLSFGEAVRKADTIGQTGQPAVGAEAAIPLTSFEDILR